MRSRPKELEALKAAQDAPTFSRIVRDVGLGCTRLQEIDYLDGWRLAIGFVT